MDKQIYIDLLKANGNIILSGAPGTGKTFLAKKIAEDMTGGDKNRMGFVQFHPSYDYTDFVEGLRPTPPSGGTIGFERKDGIFKAFCEKALKALKVYEASLTTSGITTTSVISGAVPSFVITGSTLEEKIECVYNKIVADVKAGIKHTMVTVSGIRKELYVNELGNLYILSPKGKHVALTLDMLKEISKTLKTSKDVRTNDFIKTTGIRNWTTELRAIMIYIYEIIEKETATDSRSETSTPFPENKNTNVMVEVTKPDYPYFVFIIDEINRGEMSKVFGELFFSIDPGYRGKDGKVRTQYANMAVAPNAFDNYLGITATADYGHFFVPENVYIIGTMNDIDRSVDSMDFAMRRRFMIKEVKAEDTQGDMLKLETIKKMYPSVTAIETKIANKMNALNNVIEGKPEKKIKAKFGPSYSLGASYFQKYYKYNDFDKLWEYHLEGILREYLRGTQDPDGDLDILTKVYDEA